MDVFEQKPEPPHKRTSGVKKVVREPVISAGLGAPPAPQGKQVQGSGVQDESKAAKQQGNRPHPRKRKTVTQQAATGQNPLADQAPVQASPVAPHSSIGNSHQSVLGSAQQVTPSAATSGEVQSVGAEKVAPPVNEVIKSEEKKAVSPGRRILPKVLKGGGWLVNLCSTAIISILLGFSPPVTSSPILDFIQHYKLTTLIILSIAVVLTLVILLVWPLLHVRFQPIDARLKVMGAVTSVSTLSSVLCLSLLMMTLFRPSWCPASLCAAPKVITKPITTTQGSHDANLDVSFVGFESSTYVIPGDPQRPTYIPTYTDPRSVGAILLNTPDAATPYTIAIGLHSLYTGRYNIFIDKVTLLLTKVSQAPSPLSVYSPTVTTTFSSTNPSRFVYQGQLAQQTISDSYSTSPLPRVVLRSGEADQIDAAIEARIPVDMQFTIQVTYHIATEQQRFTLMLNQTFEAVFSKSSTWRKYQLNLAQGNFVPVPGSGK